MRIGLYFVLALMLAATAFAHDDVPDSTDSLPDAGVGPRSFLWGLDKALENIKMFLTFDREERVRIGLEVAEERLAEAKEAIAEKKLGAAEEALEGYEIAMHRVEGQLTKYKSEGDGAKEFVSHIDEDIEAHGLILAELAVEYDEKSVTLGQDAAAAARKIAAAQKERLGVEEKVVEHEEVEEKIEVEEEEVEDEADDAAANETATNATVETNTTVETHLSIKAQTNVNVTKVVVTGDLEKTFTLNETGLGAITAAIAAELDLTEDAVAEALVVEDISKTPQITVSIEGNEVARITVTINGITKKITLAIVDQQSIIKEVAKRIPMDPAEVAKYAVFTTDEDTFYPELGDPDDD